ncbi:hypothetical protein I6U48_26570 [Clostridium sp. PL3]|uniref:Uncharacterized protein n=1 Tax=Clostridium thailandense TaxID=2794346 RepID=A0A949U4T8_9CLOT|nr:hypothetical protein [Clostridium thailandense]MBV7276449.1 hypothetical protein [Clostridium thailandense]
MLQELLHTLQYTLMQKLLNNSVEKFDYIQCQELFSQILNSTSYLLPNFYLTIDEVTYKPEDNYILIKFNSSTPLLNEQLLILLSINNFIITGLEVSIIY